VEEIFVPALGMAMDNVVLLEWQKNPGDAVSVGDVIAIIETDKTTMDIAAETSGVLGRHRYQINDEVPAGNTITVILGPGESE
jgi:pyruvate/2-oxoglutarate dehydrogenase complex dihydrolipoamide acyltransferase (E2) component